MREHVGERRVSRWSDTPHPKDGGQQASDFWDLLYMHRYTHTNSVLTAIFPGKPQNLQPGLAGFPLNFPSPFIPGLRILLGQA